MKIGPRYKKARRLGVPIFEKTQTQKYIAHLAKKGKTPSARSGKTDYGIQMLEKQKARFSYAVNERQFSNYVKKALNEKGDTASSLLKELESRLDNVVLRIGLVPTRSFARQVVSHRHITVNGKVVNIPSFKVSTGDIISIREGSKKSAIFLSVWEKVAKNSNIPNWIKIDPEKQIAVIDGVPRIENSELQFNIKSVLEFYTR